MNKDRIKLCVFYPAEEDAFFDMNYYCNHHIVKVKQLLGDSLKDISVERGISGGAPGSIPPYAAMACFYFDNMEAFEESFGSNAAEILADVPNFTTSKAFIQISEVIM